MQRVTFFSMTNQALRSCLLGSQWRGGGPGPQASHPRPGPSTAAASPPGARLGLQGDQRTCQAASLTRLSPTGGRAVPTPPPVARMARAEPRRRFPAGEGAGGPRGPREPRGPAGRESAAAGPGQALGPAPTEPKRVLFPLNQGHWP